jgi:translation initiation factor IF-1
MSVKRERDDIRSALKDAPHRRPQKIGPMARKGAIEQPGTVVDDLPREMYVVRLDGSNHRVTAHLSADENRNFIRILKGDRVMVRLSFWDKSRGCVMEKL